MIRLQDISEYLGKATCCHGSYGDIITERLKIGDCVDGYFCNMKILAYIKEFLSSYKPNGVWLDLTIDTNGSGVSFIITSEENEYLININLKGGSTFESVRDSLPKIRTIIKATTGLNVDIWESTNAITDFHMYIYGSDIDVSETETSVLKIKNIEINSDDTSESRVLDLFAMIDEICNNCAI